MGKFSLFSKEECNILKESLFGKNKKSKECYPYRALVTKEELVYASSPEEAFDKMTERYPEDVVEIFCMGEEDE